MENRPTYRKPNLTPTPHHRAIMKVALTLSIIFGACMIMANILGIKVFHVGIFMLDAGIFVMPIAYITGDVLVMCFHKRITNSIHFTVCLITACIAALLWLADLIPDPADINNPSMHAAFDLSIRVNLASVAAFIVSRIINDVLLRKWLAAGKSRFWSTFKSSFLAHIPDTTLFTLIAFAGREGFPTPILIRQIFTSLIAAIILEFLLNGIKIWLYNRIHAYLTKTVTLTKDPDPFYKNIRQKVRQRFKKIVKFVRDFFVDTGEDEDEPATVNEPQG